MSTSDITILVVDDNPATRYSTSRVLRSAGWNIVEAETGEEAIQKALKGVDLLVLDIHLPDIDGYEVCRRLRQYEATARLPILHLSATFLTPDHKVTGLEAGADGYLTHPIEPPVLIATVNAFLRTRQAELDLRASEARFKTIFENALTGVALLNEQLEFVDANPTMCRALRLERNDIVGRTLPDFVLSGHRALLEEMQQQIDQHSAWHGVLPLQSADESVVHLEWHVSIHTEPGLRLAITSDISDRLRYEAERESLLERERAARADAERANTLKDEFLATLSHELRTPLSAIVGWSQLLQMGSRPADELAEGLEAIERNAQAQAKMISDLLDVSRITSGKLRLDVEPLDPHTVVDSAVTAIMPTAEAKSIRITKTLDPNLGPISGDRSRLQQVLWNLINNAVKFTPRNGRVNVTLSRFDSHIEIQIADNGEGIDPELLPRLFNRFQQGDSSSTRSHGGLGLGLSIAKQLVELHGGQISVTSPGRGLGSTFTIWLPILPKSSPDSVSEREAANPVLTSPSQRRSMIDLSGTHVLLVEDDLDSRRVIRRIIVDSGGEVGEAENVERALEMIESFQPSVLVSDVGMPERDGYDLIREVRQRGFSHQTLPAIALTAFASTEDRHRALVAGFQVHLAKPVDPFELNAAIASLVGRTGSANAE